MRMQQVQTAAGNTHYILLHCMGILAISPPACECESTTVAEAALWVGEQKGLPTLATLRR